MNSIGPLHDTVTWYKITLAGEQVAQWDFQNNATRSTPPRPAFRYVWVLGKHCENGSEGAEALMRFWTKTHHRKSIVSKMHKSCWWGVSWSFCFIFQSGKQRLRGSRETSNVSVNDTT